MENTISIKVLEAIGTPNAILHSFGMTVFDSAKNLVEENRPVIIDFNGVRNLTSAFLHASVGNLVTLTPNSGNLVKVLGLDDPDWQQKLEEAIKLARDPEHQKAIASQVSDLFND